MRLTAHVEVGVYLEVIVQGRIVCMLAVSQIEEQWENLAGIEGKTLQLLRM